jgi:hypothetical protein
MQRSGNGVPIFTQTQDHSRHFYPLIAAVIWPNAMLNIEQLKAPKRPVEGLVFIALFFAARLSTAKL